MHKHVSLIGFAFLAAAAAACGGGSDGSPVALVDLPNEAATAICQRVFNCCSAAELADELSGFDPVPTTVEECAAQVAQEISAELDAAEAGIMAGTITYDADLAGACVAGLGGLACGADQQDIECDPFIGTVAIGAACASNEECVGGAYCAADVCAAEAVFELGDACPDGYCTDGSACADGTCIAPPAVGEECPDFFTCEDGAFCDSNVTPAICTAERANGEACTGGSECESGNCDGNSVCVAPTCDGN